MQLFSHLLVQTSGDVEEAMEWLRQLAEEYGIFDENLSMEDLVQKLKEMGIIEEVNNTPVLTTKGVQKIRQDALREIFSSLKKTPMGSHETPHTGAGVERLSETKKWVFGDMPTNIDLTSTMTNAFKRDGIENFNLIEDDLEVYDTENLSTCATVLMLDISHSMILYGEDRITPAKQVGLALSELIMTKFPRDYIALVVFGDDAKLVSINELPFLERRPVPHEHPRRSAARPEPPAPVRQREQADLHDHGRQTVGDVRRRRKVVQELFRARPEDCEQDAGRGRRMQAGERSRSARLWLPVTLSH